MAGLVQFESWYKSNLYGNFNIIFQALKGLQLVLSPLESEEDDEIQVLMGSDDPSANSEWLLKRLPRLPVFANYYPQISNALRVACQAENDPIIVSMYIQFLAHYAPESGTDLADLCLEVSSTIMERSTLLPAVLPGPLCKIPIKSANDTYAALLRLFIYFMNHVRRRADQPQAAEWGENEAQELILVHWKNENITATVHFFTVHAQVSVYQDFHSSIMFPFVSSFLVLKNA